MPIPHMLSTTRRPCSRPIHAQRSANQSSSASAIAPRRWASSHSSAHTTATVILREERPKDPLPVASVGAADPSQAQDDTHATTARKLLVPDGPAAEGKAEGILAQCQHQWWQRYEAVGPQRVAGQ